LAFKQTTIASASGTNSLHSRITSPVQRSCASALCAVAGFPLIATNNTTSDPAAMTKSHRARSEAVFFTIIDIVWPTLSPAAAYS
jgi:hypothetical protein